MRGQDTFDEVIHRHRRLLFSVCRRYSRDGLPTDDLLQETMIDLWQRRDQLLAIAAEPQRAAWIWRVARSTCIDLQRGLRTTEPLPEGYDPPEDDSTLHDALHEIISHLPEPDRTIVTMHLEGYEYKEIGHRTGFTKNNVGIRLMRIKDKLREQWNKE